MMVIETAANKKKYILNFSLAFLIIALYLIPAKRVYNILTITVVGVGKYICGNFPHINL